jgi:hypothetical protein
VSTSEARLYEVPDTCFRIGNTRRSPVLYKVKHDKPTWGAVRKQWQVLPRFLRRALRGRSQARGPVTTPSTESCPPIWQQKKIPQYELDQRTTILRPKGMFAFMENMIIEVLLVPFWPLSVCAARA